MILILGEERRNLLADFFFFVVVVVQLFLSPLGFCASQVLLIFFRLSHKQTKRSL